MSLFPRSYFTPEASFTPLFRLLDDFDSYNREVSGQGNKSGRRNLPTFSPRFDVKETETGYELHGELPGVEKDNIHIEFTEPQTIVISGRSERHYTSGTPPAGLIDNSNATNTITESGEKDSASSHKASVADEETENAKEQGSEVANKTEQPKQETEQQPKQKRPTERFWVSERSVGEFSRTFSFPTPVDQEAVSANLTNGVLSVTVPKAKKHESKRISVN